MSPQHPAYSSAGPQRSRLRIVIFLIAVVLLIVIGVSIAASITNSRKANDIERQTDIAALNKGIQSYNQEYDAYPTLDQLADRSYTEQYMADVKAGAFTDPGGNAVSGSGGGYVYAPVPKGCDNVVVYCTGYSLRTTLNDGSVLIEKN